VWLQQARSYLRNADPVLARLIDGRPDFDPRAWMAQLPPMDLFGALLWALVIAVLDDQVAGGRAANVIDYLVQRRQGQLAVVRHRVENRGPPPGGCGQITLARQFRSRLAGG
jgi:hypothetical protein